MNLKEAIRVIGTQSGDVKGVRKRLGADVVRRPLPAGYTADIRKKKKRKKKKDDEDQDDDSRANEGRRITRDDRPTYSGQWDKGFWSTGDNHSHHGDDDDEEEEEDESEEELKELLMQLSGGFDYMRMHPFWEKGDNNKDVDSDDDEEDDEEDDNLTDEAFHAASSQTIGVTARTDPHFSSKAQDPFWRKGNQYEPDNDDESDDEDEDEDEVAEEYIDTFKHDLVGSGKTDVDLYKNPTPQEFRELVKDRRVNAKDSFRFVVTYGGDIYAVGSMADKSALIFHEDILNVLRNRGIMNPTRSWAENPKESLKKFGCFTYQQKEGRVFTFSESYGPDDNDIENRFTARDEWESLAEHYKEIIQNNLMNRKFVMGISPY